MDRFHTFRKAAGLALCGMLAAGPGRADAAELPPGTRIDAKNVDAVQTDSFEGHTIADLMPPSMLRAVKEAGMVIDLKASTPMRYNARVIEATKLQGATAGIDDKRHLTGFTTGIPFMNISDTDPQGGLKLIYNIMRSPWFADAVDFDPMVFLTTTKAQGLSKELHTKYGRLLQNGRLSQPYILADDGVVKREMLMFTYSSRAA